MLPGYFDSASPLPRHARALLPPPFVIIAGLIYRSPPDDIWIIARAPRRADLFLYSRHFSLLVYSLVISFACRHVRVWMARIRTCFSGMYWSISFSRAWQGFYYGYQSFWFHSWSARMIHDTSREDYFDTPSCFRWLPRYSRHATHFSNTGIHDGYAFPLYDCGWEDYRTYATKGTNNEKDK